MDRRKFLTRSGALLAALAMPRFLRAAPCETTSPDAYGIGPFYLGNAPARTTALALASEPGEKLLISGTIRDCAAPLTGAVLELWQANALGCYADFPEYQTCAEYPEPGKLRGIFGADAQGRYSFSTIMPGAYTDGGGKYRTPHIHVKVTLPPSSGRSVELITQLYFQGAPYLDTDDGASDAQSVGGTPRIIALSANPEGGSKGTFDISLNSVTALRESRGVGASEGIDVLITRSARDFRFVLPPNRLRGTVSLQVRLPSGRAMHTSHHSEREIPWDASRFPAGIYVIELTALADGSREKFPVRL